MENKGERMSTLYNQASIHDIDCPDWDGKRIEKCTCESSQALKELNELYARIEELEDEVDRLIMQLPSEQYE